MLTPALIRPRRSVGVLLYPFVLGLAFAAASTLAHRAGEAWSPAPSWSQPSSPPPATASSSARVADRPMRAAGCAYQTPSGLGYRVIRGGEGIDAPRRTDTVALRLSGWEHGGGALPIPASPARFRVDHLIPGFVEGLGMMSVGERWILCVPQTLAYNGRSGAPAGLLVFDVELLAIERAQAGQ